MNLKNLRKSAGLTQQQLADKSGISRVTLARLELGVCKPCVDTLRALATALCCTVDALLEDTAAS